MGEVKGYRLYVNLPASQVRRRLKGYGFGVRKVESAGKSQALVIHTATGHHYRDRRGDVWQPERRRPHRSLRRTASAARCDDDQGGAHGRAAGRYNRRPLSRAGA